MLTRAKEAPSHSLGVTKPACAGDLLDRETPLLEHQPSDFQSKLSDSPGGRAPCFDSKGSTELARALPSYLCQPLDRKVFPEVKLEVASRSFNAPSCPNYSDISLVSDERNAIWIADKSVRSVKPPIPVSDDDLLATLPPEGTPR